MTSDVDDMGFPALEVVTVNILYVMLLLTGYNR